MPENVNLKIGVPRIDDKIYSDRKIGKPRTSEPVNLQSVIRDIKARNTAPEVEAELIRKATSYPHGALPLFRRNLGHHIIVAQQSLKTKE